jgi:hypothetical protein
MRAGGVWGWPLLLLFFELVQKGHSLRQGIRCSMDDTRPDFAFLGILLGRVAEVGTGFIGQSVHTVIAKPKVMLTAVLRLLLRQVCLHLDRVEAVDVGMAEVTSIFRSVVVLIDWVIQGLDNSLAINNKISRGQKRTVTGVGRG